MPNLTLGTDVANKTEKISTTACIVAKSYSKLYECFVTVLLLTSTPLGGVKGSPVKCENFPLLLWRPQRQFLEPQKNLRPSLLTSNVNKKDIFFT